MLENIDNKLEILEKELLERNKKFDVNFNKINYYNELQKTKKLIDEFTGSLIEQMVILAAGGHRSILQVLDKANQNDFLWDEIRKDENGLLNDLASLYEGIMLTHSGLSSILDESNLYLGKVIENIVEKMD